MASRSRMKVPDYIGYPGKQTSSNYGGDFKGDYDNIVDDKIVVAKIIPGKPIITGDANIFRFENDWKTYSKDLDDLGIDPPGNGNQLNIVISQLSPITRSYDNNYGDSSIFPTKSFLAEGLRDIVQMSGGNTEAMEKLLKSKDRGFLGMLLGRGVGGYNAFVNGMQNAANEAARSLGGDAGDILKGVANATADLAKSPQSKINWPKMWRDCGFVQTYQLNTRLYCFSTNNKDDFNNNIRACIGALELLVTPKSSNGALYTAPYIIQFDIPGMLHFPQAYVQSMQVIEGGNEGDFAQTGRPNVVDISMTIQSMYSISVNVRKDHDKQYRPSVRKDLIGLSDGRNIDKASSYNGGDGSAGRTITYEEAEINHIIESDPKITSEAAEKIATNNGKRQLTEEQKKIIEALKNPDASNVDVDDTVPEEDESISG